MKKENEVVIYEKLPWHSKENEQKEQSPFKCIEEYMILAMKVQQLDQVGLNPKTTKSMKTDKSCKNASKFSNEQRMTNGKKTAKSQRKLYQCHVCAEILKNKLS